MSILNGCEFRGLRKTLGQKARVFTRNDFGFLDLHIISFAFVSSIFRTIQAELVTVPSAFSPRINKKAKAGERLTRIQGSLETGAFNSRITPGIRHGAPRKPRDSRSDIGPKVPEDLCPP